jgi:branched-chain amino acid transport system substrate-binding protein
MTARTITVGAMLSLSGRFAVQGEQARRGLTLWADDLNLSGGLIVRALGGAAPVRLVIHDDTSRAGPAVLLAERLASPASPERADLLFGPYSSVLALAIAPIAEQYRRVLWNHGGSSDAIDERGFRYTVTVLSPAGRYFVPLLDLIRATTPALRRVAILHGARGTFPSAVAAGAATHALARGFEVVFTAPYPDLIPLPLGESWGEGAPRGDETGGAGNLGAAFAALVAEIEASHPDMVLGVGTTEADLAFARTLGAERAGARVVGLVAAPIEHFGEALGPRAHGFFGPSQWEPGVRYRPDLGPTSTQFADRFRTRFGAEPDYPAAQAYAAGLIMQRCVEIAGSLDDEALLQVARSLTLTTFYGDFRLDPATGRQVGHDLVVMQWQGMRRRIVWPPTLAEATPEIPPSTYDGRPA